VVWPERCLGDSQRTLVERQGISRPLELPVGGGQVAEPQGGVRVIRAERGLGDCQSPVLKGQRISRPPEFSVCAGQAG
jgi:hypothetical protein